MERTPAMIRRDRQKAGMLKREDILDTIAQALRSRQRGLTDAQVIDEIDRVMKTRPGL